MSRKVERGLTARSLIIGAIGVLLYTWFFVWGIGFYYRDYANPAGYLSNFYNWAAGLYLMPIHYAMMLVMPVVVLYAIGAAGPRLKLTKQELGIIYTMMLVVGGIPGFHGVLCWMGGFGLETWAEPWRTWAYLDQPGIWWPHDPEILHGIFFGGSPVPWGAWMPHIMFWWAFTVIYCFYYLMLGTMLRRRLVDIEALPFPLATAPASVIESAAGGKEVAPPLHKYKWLWIGFLLGFIWDFPSFLNGIWKDIPAYTLGVDLSPTINYWIPLVINATAWGIGWGYLLGIDHLITFVIGYIVLYFIYVPIAVTTGILPSPWPRDWIDTQGHLCSWYNPSPIPGSAIGFALISFGSLLGIALWPIISSPRSVLETIKAFFQKPAPEVEAREPMNYRVMFALFIIAVILYFTMVVGLSGAYLVSTLILLAISTLFIIGGARTRGEMGNVLGGWFAITTETWDQQLAHFIYMPEFGDPTGTKGGVAPFVTNYIFRDSLCWTGANMNTTLYSVELYSLGSRLGIRSREQFIAMIIAFVISPIAGILIFLNYGYAWGINMKWTGAGLTEWGSACHHQSVLVYTRGGTPINWTTMDCVWLAIFAVITLIFYGIRTKFPGLPINPAMFPFVSNSPSAIVFFPFLIALILKWLTLRIGGTKLYTEKGQPIAVGLLLGHGMLSFLCMFIVALMTYIRV